MTALAVTATAAACSALAACSVGPASIGDEIKNKNLTGHVTYYANGGMFENNSIRVITDIYYKADTPIINVGLDDVTDVSVSREGSVLVRWCYAQLDESGEPVLVDKDGNPVIEAVNEEGDLILDDNNKAKYMNENGDIFLHNQVYPVSTGEALDFSTFRIAKNQHIYLCAEWVEDISIEFRLVCDEDIADSDGNTYSTGDVIGNDYFGTATVKNLRASAPLNATGATFIRFYDDITCTEEHALAANTPIDKPEEGNVIVYAKYIVGNWTKVETSSDVNKMMNNVGLATNKYYIMNDIDCSAIELVMRRGNFAYFACTIRGNGYKLSNLKFKGTVKAGASYSAFGAFTDKAVIENLTLENVTVTANVPTGGVNLYAVCNGYADGATIDGLTIDGLNLVLNKGDSAVIYNIQKIDGEYVKDHYLFDDGTNVSTDAAFLAAFSGVTVTNAIISEQENQ